MEVDYDMEMKAREKPLISVTISTYNSGATIEEVLNSLLIQDYPLKLIEVIVVDDHSVDNTTDKVRKFMERYHDKFYDFKLVIHERNLGVSKARNDGIKLARGEYIMILDSDVVLPPNAISKMVSFMESNPSVGCCHLLLKTDSMDIISRWLWDVNIGKIRRIVCCTAAAMIRREVTEKAGLFDEAMGPPFSVDEDLEFAARIWRAGYQCIMLGDITARHLMIKRDIQLAKLKGEKDQHRLTLSTYGRWLVGYLKKKHAQSWYKFLKSLPLKLRIRYAFSSLFLPCLIISFFGSLLQLSPLMYIVTLTLLLAIFLDVLRDFISSPRKIHKSIILASLACINRSVRGIAAFCYAIRARNVFKH